MEIRLKKENIAIILVDTQIPENIGAAARAINNMGMERLILVNPKRVDRERMLKSGTIHSERIIDNIEIFSDLKEAIGGFGYVAGTTARLGTYRPAMTAPVTLARNLLMYPRIMKLQSCSALKIRGSQMNTCSTVIQLQPSQPRIFHH
jgi:tRNA/rRNA methyltransferase